MDRILRYARLLVGLSVLGAVVGALTAVFGAAVFPTGNLSPSDARTIVNGIAAGGAAGLAVALFIAVSIANRGAENANGHASGTAPQPRRKRHP